MVEYKCQDCGEVIGFLSNDELARRIASGEVTKSTRFFRGPDWRGDEIDKHEDGYFGICRRCKRLHATAPLQGKDPEFARHQRIMERLRFIRRNQPELPLAEAVSRAVEDEFEPINEPDAKLRRYLLDRGDPNEYADAGARQVLAQLEAAE